MPRPPFDSELATFLELVGDRLPPSIRPGDIAAFRESARANRLSDADLCRDGRITVGELTVPGPPDGPELSLLVCRPASRDQVAPTIYHIHGGGMIMGDSRTGLAPLLDWVERLGVVVVSVDYRLAPEHPFPAGVEDCYAGLCWTVEHASDLGVDPSRVVLAGTSAGGGLAAAVALMARDRRGPAVIGQLLMCPMLDDRETTHSSTELLGEGVWDQVSNRTGWAALLGSAVAGPGVSPYAAPARCEDLSGLPPAFIDVGSAETFRDEDVDYAARLWRAGVQAELHVWPGGFHGFDVFAPEAVLSRSARAARLDWLARLLGIGL